MNMNSSIGSFLVVISFVCASCTNSATNDDNNVESTPDSVANVMSVDTTHQGDTAVSNESELRAIDDWKIADFIITEKYKSSEAVRRTIENEVQQWKNVKSPFVATYTGCDMGDYFHLNFEDSTGKAYDFGFGNNQFGAYALFDKDLIDNPKYIGKSFVICWNWEISSFPCCDGEYDLVEAYMPSITGLELKRN